MPLRSLLLRFALSLLLCASPLTQALAQSNPGWASGYIPTAAQWAAAFSAKQDVGTIPGSYPAANLTGSALPSGITSAPGLNALAGGPVGTAAYQPSTAFAQTGQPNSFGSGFLQTIYTSLAPPRTVTGNTTIAASDCGNAIIVNSATAATVTTLSTNPAGCEVTVEQKGAGQVTIANGASATQSSSFSYNATRTQNSKITLYVDVAANYNITGDGAATGGGGGGGASVVACAANTPSSGLLVTGSTVNIACTFSAPVTVTGTPTIGLSTSPAATVSYGSGSGTTILTFPYTVASGQNTPIGGGPQIYLATTSSGIQLAGGTITNGGTAATLTGSNNQVFTGLAVNTGTVFYATAAGSGSTCSSGSKCSVTGCQTKMRASGGTCYLDAAATYSSFSTLVLESSGGDNNTGYSNLPGTSPVLDGGASSNGSGTAIAITIGASSSGAGITINGLTLQHFGHTGLDAQAFSGVTASNLTIQNIYSASTNQGCVYLHYQMSGANLLTNIKCQNNTGPGFVVSIANGNPGWSSSGSMTWQYNQMISVNTTLTDTGAYYWDDQTAGCNASTVSCSIKNNSALNWGHSTGDATKAVYLDDNTSWITVSNNWFAGTGQYVLQIHGGANNTFTDDVFDISAAEKLGYYQTSSLGTANMVGNSLVHNIVYSAASPPSALWDSTTTETAPTVGPNQYFDTTGAFPNYGDSASFVVDPSPNVGNPLFVNASANNYQLQATSPALVSPVSFPQLPATALLGPH